MAFLRSQRHQFLELVVSLRAWKGGTDARAPHKPVLLLSAMAELQADHETPRLRPYSHWEGKLLPLLKLHLPGKAHPHYPWFRLVNDSLWDIPSRQAMPTTDSGDVHVGWLRDNPAATMSGLRSDHHAMLLAHPSLLDQAVRLVLLDHFAHTVRPGVIEDVGLDHDLDEPISLPAFARASRARRDPAFAGGIHEAYGSVCAVCSFDGARDGVPVGIDACHVKWHQHQGPDTVENGIALCSLHHVLFDRGTFRFEPLTRRLVVSPRYHDSRVDWLRQHADRTLLVPNGPPPAEEFLKWHHANVFLR